MTVKIPFLSMIPLPLLEVKRAHFAFGLRVIDQVYVDKVIGRDDPVEPDHRSSDIQALLVSERVTESEERYEPGLVSNMQVTVEIEQSDIPAGLLELMNLSQGASEGKSDVMYRLSANPSKLSFGPSAEQQTLEIRIDPLIVERGSQDEILVNIEVVSSTIALEDLFARPIRVEEGAVVGIPSIRQAQVLTTADGVVALSFLTKSTVGNGFVKIKADDQELLVYFDVHLLTTP